MICIGVFSGSGTLQRSGHWHEPATGNSSRKGHALRPTSHTGTLIKQPKFDARPHWVLPDCVTAVEVASESCVLSREPPDQDLQG